MTLEVMIFEDFNEHEVFMLKDLDPSEVHADHLQPPDILPLGYELELVELSQWAPRLVLQAEHHRLFEACFSTSLKDQKYWLNTEHSLIAAVIVRAKGELVASVQACSIGPVATIENVMTHEDHRCKGLATVAMKVLMRWLPKHAELVILRCQPKEAQLKLYGRFGFEVRPQRSHHKVPRQKVVV